MRRQRGSGLFNDTYILLIGLSSCVGFNYHPMDQHRHQYHNLKHQLKPAQILPPRQKTSLLQSSKNPIVENNHNNDDGEVTFKNQTSSSTFSYLIPPEQLELLTESVDIVSAIESYNLPQFRRSTGGNTARATALCPFHNDNNPSLQIDGTRRIYKCFSCGAGGNIIQFVREYSKVVNGEEVSFYQAVRQVNEKFTNGSPLPLLQQQGGGKSSSMTSEEIQAQMAQKERILLANAMAAAFYANCLISLNGGAARSHLTKRGLTGPTVRAFAIGFAPDVYYGNRILESNGAANTSSWGEGSLVHHLRDSNFTPQEIIDAGLAVRTKKRSGGGTSSSKKSPAQKKASIRTNTGNKDNYNATILTAEEEEDDMDYTTLMDRFRGRLVVPIFDVTGNKVLGFGGRILGQPVETSSFKAPKYLNSPDSKVFKKKVVLFGHHMAKEAIDKAFKQTNEDIEVKATRRPLVLVEGYMDAMALWQAGIKEVVSCMGTGLTEEQLLAAARIAGSRGGSVVLCLDGDDAGITAVERVCSSGLLASVSSKLATEIRVATLPDDRKDPAEYIEMHHKSSNNPVAEDFRSNVIDTSVEWTDWHLNRIMGQFDPSVIRGGVGSFGDIFERVANFLATFQNAAERTERACQVAASLADIMSRNGSGGAVSNTVRIQLESDLVDKVSRIAMSKEATTRRLESVDGGSEIEIQTKLSNMARGDGPSGTDDQEKMSNKAMRANPSNVPKTRKFTPSSDGLKQKGKKTPQRRKVVKPPQRRGYKPPKELMKQDVIPHHQGFRFQHETDATWMESNGENKRKKNDGLNLAVSSKTGTINELGQKKPVWFNSNEYNGEQFITDEAVSAGYSSIVNVRDPGLLEKGISALIEPDADSMSSSAEKALLRALVLFRRARRTLKHSMDMSSDATGSAAEGIEWSDPHMAWLFSSLVEKGSTIPTSLTGPEHAFEIRSHLAALPDAPPGAFGEVRSDEVEAIEGIPDLDQPLATDGATIEEVENVGAISNEDFIAADVDNVDDWAANVDPSFLEMVTEAPEASDESKRSKVSEATSEGPGQLLLNSATEAKTVVGQDSPQDTAESRDGEIILGETTLKNIGSRILDSPGTLDRLFLSEEDIFTSSNADLMAPEKRAELAVQDLYATLLWTSSLKRLSRLRENLLLASNILQNFDNDDGRGKELLEASRTSLVVAEGPLTSQELLGYCANVTAQIRDAFETSQHLGSSARHITKRLMDAAVMSRSSEFRFSKNEYNDLCEKLDQHMTELNKYPEYLPENGSEPEEFYEDFLEQKQLEWGDLYYDSRLWSPEDIEENGRLETNESHETANMGDMDYLYEDGTDDVEDDGESLEDFHKRIDEDYAAWEDPIPTADPLESDFSHAMDGDYTPGYYNYPQE